MLRNKGNTDCLEFLKMLKFFRLMSLNNKILNEILDIAEQNFICLRCAECCYRWAVQFAEGIKKPENHRCPYLINISIEKNQYKEAYCTIYGKRPDVCKNFKISFATVCPIGLWKWSKLHKTNPNINLPERVNKITQILMELK